LQGGWETDETVEEAACREALEEAGVRGLLQGKLGSWDFKSKRQQGVFCPEGLCRAHMFALAVTEQLDNWPEQHARHRQWVSLTPILPSLPWVFCALFYSSQITPRKPVQPVCHGHWITSEMLEAHQHHINRLKLTF
jgi:8-oxo-dGTP pyrophosphatase MutT (NUDIX family)